MSASESKIVTTTLAALGPRLPIGVPDNAGGYAKDIAVRPWRFKEERELGEIRDQNKDANLPQYVAMVLATMCTRLGSHNFEERQSKFAEKRVVIGQMFMPDVMYAYIWLRLQALGSDVSLEVRCSHCTKKGEMVADLNTMEVKTVEALADALWPVELKTPITVRGKTVSKLTLGPLRWNALEMMGASPGQAKPGVILGSVHAIEGLDNVVLADGELDDLTKRDIERLSALINDKAVGPQMAVEYKCQQCTRTTKQPIDWGYDSFFASSSR